MRCSTFPLPFMERLYLRPFLCAAALVTCFFSAWLLYLTFDLWNLFTICGEIASLSCISSP